MIYNNNSELLSINCKIIEMSLIDPSNYKILILTNEVIRKDVLKFEPLSYKETKTENLKMTIHNKTMQPSLNRKNLPESQVIKEKNQSPKELIQTKQPTKSQSNNNYINITEDYNYEINKNVPNENNNLMSSNNNYSAEEKKIGPLQIHISRNQIDQNDKKRNPEVDISSYNLDNYLPLKSINLLK